MIGLGIGCCCQGDCEGLCSDVTNVAFLVELTGFADGSGAPASCAACSTFNATFTLTYADAVPVTIPGTGCAFEDGHDFGPICYYTNRTVCEADDPMEDDLIIDVTLAIYISGLGDRRAFLQVLVNGDGQHVVGKDFAVATGSGSVTCLDIAASDTFDVCSTTGTVYCTAPTDFILTAVEA